VTTAPSKVLEVELTNGEVWPTRAIEVEEAEAVERGREMEGVGMGVVHVEPITATFVDNERGVVR